MPATQFQEKIPYLVFALKYTGTNGDEMKVFAPSAIRLNGADTYLTQNMKEDLLLANQWVIKSPVGTFTAMNNREFAILYEAVV